MSVDKYDNDDVELPDPDQETTPVAMFGLRTKILIGTLGAAALLFLSIAFLLTKGKEQIIASIPKMEKAWILSRVEGESIASDQPKTVLDGRGVMLYMVVYGRDEVAGESFYYLNAPTDDPLTLVIEGDEVPADKIREFSFVDTKSIVYWYKVELHPQFLARKRVPISERIYWTDSRKHNMGKLWWAIADVRSDISSYHYDYVGSMYYYAELEVFDSDDPDKVHALVKTIDESKNETGKIPVDSHRITMIPSYRTGLDSFYRAYFNLVAHQENENQLQNYESTDQFQGGNSQSILTGALKLMGHDIDPGDSEFLETSSDLIFDNVTLDSFLYFRKATSEAVPIPYGEGGVQNGDIIVRGDRYMVLVGNTPSDDEPKGGVLTGDDVVLDAWNGFVRETYAHFLEEQKGPIQIWRPRKP